MQHGEGNYSGTVIRFLSAPSLIWSCVKSIVIDVWSTISFVEGDIPTMYCPFLMFFKKLEKFPKPCLNVMVYNKKI
jgi:hypothetical protein